MKIKDIDLEIMQGDITELEVDAIVNAANNKLVMGGGLARAIRKKGGKAIEDEAVKKGPISIGEATVTKAGSLKAKFVIHAATMGMDFQTDEVKIRNAAGNALKRAQENKLKSCAFPALGCGVGGFPFDAAARIMAQEMLKYARQDNASLKRIIFCLFDKEAFDIFHKTVFGYIEYMLKKTMSGPYVTVDTIIEYSRGIILVKRRNPPFGWAIPGGFVDYGESLEEAAKREAKEETNLDLEDLVQFHTYSQANRDPRFHTVSTVFVAQGKGKPRAASDAADLKVFDLESLPDNIAFDHKEILKDYFEWKKQNMKLSRLCSRHLM